MSANSAFKFLVKDCFIDIEEHSFLISKAIDEISNGLKAII